jgi:hypothetical protein
LCHFGLVNGLECGQIKLPHFGLNALQFVKAPCIDDLATRRVPVEIWYGCQPFLVQHFQFVRATFMAGWSIREGIMFYRARLQWLHALAAHLAEEHFTENT